MRKLKSAIDRLAEKGIVGKPIDLDPDWYRKHLKEQERLKEEARKEEENRIKKIKCPSGIFFVGYKYFVCKKCGTMFKDIEKYKKSSR